MLRHSNIWLAIDRLAQERGLTTSGLARLGGLDPTTFNKSKRQAHDGRLRWPSTESIAKVLEATGATLGEFLAFAGDGTGIGSIRNLPLIGVDQVTGKGYFDDFGHPIGEGWDKIPFPELRDPQAFALEVMDDRLAPIYRQGDVLVVSPNAGPRRGDRIVARVRPNRFLFGTLVRRSALRLELTPLPRGEQELALPMERVHWVGRIIWCSQ